MCSSSVKRMLRECIICISSTLDLSLKTSLRIRVPQLSLSLFIFVYHINSVLSYQFKKYEYAPFTYCL